MNKLKLFLENFLVYGLGGIISKAVPLLMVPVVTRLMPSSEYFGLCDLSNVITNFAVYFSIMGMYDAMYRLFFDKDDTQFKQSVCSTAFIFTLITSLIVFSIMLIFKDIVAVYFFNNTQYTYLVYICAISVLVGATNAIVSAPTRMQNNRKVFLVTNTLSPIIAYSISIPMLLKGYYVTALPIAGVISGFILELSFWYMNKQWFRVKFFDFKLLKQLLTLAIPLAPSFFVYWIFSSCDKIMITNILGIKEAGIYAVGAKLGTASQLIYLAFAGGWQYFAFSTMNEKEQVKNNSLVFEYLGAISFISTAFVCAISNTFFKFIFSFEYLSGFIVAPYLFMSPLLLMLYQIIGNQFLVVKKAWPSLIILSVGALTNFLLNLWLIPLFGIEGAAVATLTGYIVTVIIGLIVLYKMKLVVVSKAFSIMTLFVIIYFTCWRLIFASNVIYGLIFTFLLMTVCSIIYKNVLYMLYFLLRQKL